MENLAYIERKKVWTYKDVQKLNDGNRHEVINGKLYTLASPNIMHQKIRKEISSQIGNYLKGKISEVYSAPLDVNFEKEADESTNFVKPDIFVLCDQTRKEKNQVLGAPTLIIEIISPGYEEREYLAKLNLYLTNKVKEYWIVNPRWRVIEKHILEKDSYINEIHGIRDKVKVGIFDDLTIDISKVYDENEYLLRKESAVYKETRFKMSAKLKDYIYRHFDDDFVIEEQEALILEIILSYKKKWTQEDLNKFGRFSKSFEIINGELYYKPI